LLDFHLELWEKTWKGEANYHALKRFFKIYVKGFDGASELREQLMGTSSIDEARSMLKGFPNSGY
jgi:tRNA-dihydrouridine synthase